MLILYSCRQTLLWGLLALAGINCPAALAVDSAELANPGFDQPAQNGLPPGWALDAAVTSKGRVQLLDKRPGASGQVMVLQPNGRNTGDKLLGVGQLLNATRWRGRTVSIQVRLGASDSGTAVVGVHALGKGGDLGNVQLTQTDSGGELRNQNHVLAVPANADILIVYAIATGQSGQAFFDSVNIGSEQLAARTESAPPVPQTSTAAEGRVNITVNAHQVVRVIPSTLYGTNVEWIFDGQGLWSSKKNALDTEVLRLSKEIGPTVIRFPGGVFSDTYHWRDGIGPQDKRPTTLHHPGGPKSRHVLGSQEIAEVARFVGAELMFTVNAGTGTPQEAADWVNYAKKEIQPKVRWWEIGNELYMKGDLSGAEMSASKYTQKFMDFAKAMRAADPDIRIGAIGGLNYGNYRFIADDRWTETLLKQAAPQVDFLAIHNAYAPVVIGVKETADARAVYQAMLAAPQQIETNLKDVSALLAKYENPARPISLAITEWGPFFHVLPASPWVDHVKTMGSALFVASTLNTFLRAPRVEMANFFKLTDNAFMGWVGRRQGGWTSTAPGMAFSMYRHHLGKNLVQTEVSSPTFSTSGLGVVSATSKVPLVDAVATLDNGTLAMMLVNKSDTQVMDGDITLYGVSSFTKVSTQTLSASALDAHTGTELPQIPGLKWAKQVELSRFNRGAPGEIRLQEGTLTAKSKASKGAVRLSYKLPPLSITAMTLDRVGLDKPAR